MTKVTCSDLTSSYASYAGKMNAGYRMGWDAYGFKAFDVSYEMQQVELPEECRPVEPLYEMPEGYSMYEWDKPAGKVLGNYIIVTSDKELRPYIEAHELGHAWNMVEGGYGKSVDELQACIRGARYIPYFKRAEYWTIMWAYLQEIGVQLAWDGYVFSYPPDQIEALQFAWSVANGYFVLAMPLAVPIK